MKQVLIITTQLSIKILTCQWEQIDNIHSVTRVFKGILLSFFSGSLGMFVLQISMFNSVQKYKGSTQMRILYEDGYFCMVNYVHGLIHDKYKRNKNTSDVDHFNIHMHKSLTTVLNVQMYTRNATYITQLRLRPADNNIGNNNLCNN